MRRPWKERNSAPPGAGKRRSTPHPGARPQARHRPSPGAELGKALTIGNQAEADRILSALAKKG